jgi:hypothetical protein
MDERITSFQRIYLTLVVVDADDVMAHLGEANCSDETDIAGAYYGNLN